MLADMGRRALMALLALVVVAGAAGCGDDAPAEAPAATTTAAAVEPASATVPAPTTEAVPFDEDDLVAAGMLTLDDFPARFAVDDDSTEAGREPAVFVAEECDVPAYLTEAYRREISQGIERFTGDEYLRFQSHLYLYLDDALAQDAFAAVTQRDVIECERTEGLRQLAASADDGGSTVAVDTVIVEIDELDASAAGADEVAGWRMTFEGLPSAADYEPMVGDTWYLRFGRALLTVDVAAWHGAPPEDEVQRVLDLLATRVAAAPQGESVPTPEP
jgi:hypothetical protein